MGLSGPEPPEHYRRDSTSKPAERERDFMLITRSNIIRTVPSAICTSLVFKSVRIIAQNTPYPLGTVYAFRAYSSLLSRRVVANSYKGTPAGLMRAEWDGWDFVLSFGLSTMRGAKEVDCMCAKVRGWPSGGFILRRVVGFILTANDWVGDKREDCFRDSVIVD